MSGHFVTPSDFYVLMLWDRGNKYEHYHFKYLPDDDFTSMVLEFDVEVTNLQPIDDPRFEWILWRSLSYIRATAQAGQSRCGITPPSRAGRPEWRRGLSPLNGTPVAFDRVTL